MSGIKNSGKKTKEWEKTRAELKKKFIRWGVTTCELRLKGCYIYTHLGFAHVDKRRKLGEGEIESVILACNPCHDLIEYDPNMRSIVEKVIEARSELLRARGEVF